MNKKILIFADGTGNAFTTQESNVWRLFRAVDQSQPDQIARYIRGVGTSGFRPLAILDGATGIGVPSNVRKLYRFICWNWEPGDEIWLFGFSRGSFTVRTLAGLIDREGLVPSRIDGSPVSRADMVRNAMAAWRSYRTQTASEKILPTIRLTRAIRNVVTEGVRRVGGYLSYQAVTAETRLQSRKHVRIDFLGVFDTVEAYGVPFEELRVAIDWAVWPISFRNEKVSSKVVRACHALSLDDERTSFHPIRMDTPAPGSSQSIKEVWFAGVHSDVGGGYPDGAVAYLPLVWMAEEAERSGLRFRPEIIDAFRKEASPFGPLHDSRSGLAGFYRYAPRCIQTGAKTGRAPVIHHSVLEKMTLGSERYAPVSMPATALLLMPRVDTSFGGRHPLLATLGHPLRTIASLGKPVPEVHGNHVRQLVLADALVVLPQFRSKPVLPAPDAGYLELTEHTVWRRRVGYFGLLASVTMLLSLPLTIGYLTSIARSVIVGSSGLIGAEDAGNSLWAYLVAINAWTAGILAWILGKAGGVLPSWIGTWTAVITDHLLMALPFLVMAIVFYRGNTRLGDEIADHVHCAWSANRGAQAPPPSRLMRLGRWLRGIGPPDDSLTGSPRR